VLRTVSPETRLLVSPSSKAASAAISKVQRLVSYPNSLGERWSISRKRWALCSSKVARGSFWDAKSRHSESLKATLVEVVDGVAHRLLAASEVLSDSRHLITP